MKGHRKMMNFYPNTSMRPAGGTNFFPNHGAMMGINGYPQPPQQGFGNQFGQIPEWMNQGQQMMGMPNQYPNQGGMYPQPIPQQFGMGYPQGGYPQPPMMGAPQPNFQLTEKMLPLIKEFGNQLVKGLQSQANKLPVTPEDYLRALTPTDPWCSQGAMREIMNCLNEAYDIAVREGAIQHGAPVNIPVFRKAAELFWSRFERNLTAHVVSAKQNEMIQQSQAYTSLMTGQVPQGPYYPMPQQPVYHGEEGNSRTPNMFSKGTPKSQRAQEVQERLIKGMETMATPRNVSPNALTHEEETELCELNQWYHSRGIYNGRKSDECKTVEEKRALLDSWKSKVVQLQKNGLFVPTKDECKRWNLKTGNVYAVSERSRLEAEYQNRQEEERRLSQDKAEMEKQSSLNEFDSELAVSHISDVIEDLNCGVSINTFGKCKNSEVDSLVTELQIQKGVNDLSDFITQVEEVESISDTEEFTHVVDTRFLTVLPIPTETIKRIRGNLKSKLTNTSNRHLWKIGIDTIGEEKYAEVKPLVKFLGTTFTDLAKRHIRMDEDMEGKITLEDFTDIEDLINHEYKRFSKFPVLKERLITLANKTIEMVLIDDDSLCTRENHVADILRTEESNTLLVNGKFKDDVFFGTDEERDLWTTGFFETYTVFRIRTRVALTNLIEDPEDGEEIKLVNLGNKPKLLRLFKGLDYVSDLREQNEFEAPLGNISKLVACEKGMGDDGMYVKPISIMDIVNVTNMSLKSRLGKEIYLIPSGN